LPSARPGARLWAFHGAPDAVRGRRAPGSVQPTSPIDDTTSTG
jgi:hypothetical protein